MKLIGLLIVATVAYAKEPRHSVFGDTISGQVEGEVVVLPDGYKVNSFKGIPYAKPPLRELRFKPPLVPDAWSQVLKTTEFHTMCVQTHVFTDLEVLKTLPHAPESEDCLYLNVFAPHEKSSNPDGYPVMFWIHGGGLNCGSVHEYGDKKITQLIVPRGIVFVSITYRMGPYGFASTGDSEAPGNNGMLDMVMSLEWVRDNIKRFGGDPARVTVFGESAGAAATSLLSLSPLSRDLFQQAIFMSGAGTAPWNLGETSISATFKLAEVLQCDLPSTAQLLDCLRTKSVPEIQSAYLSFMNLTSAKLLDFGVTMDQHFLPKPVSELFREAPNIPCMAGTTAAEAGFFVTPTLPLVRHMATTHTEKTFSYKIFKDTITSFLSDEEFKNGDLLRRLALHHYLHGGDKKNVTFLLQQYTEVLGDLLFHVPQYTDALNRAKRGTNVWLYSYNYYDQRTFAPENKFRGAYHASELQYLLDALWNPYLPEDNDETKLITDILVSLWTNFVRFGNPTPTEVPYGRWEKLTADQPWRHYQISETPGMSATDFHRSAVEFWTQLVVDIAQMPPAAAKLAVTRHEEL